MLETCQKAIGEVNFINRKNGNLPKEFKGIFDGITRPKQEEIFLEGYTSILGTLAWFTG